MTEKKIRCVISAGPTREHFDPVRYISNPSTGKMGYALAEAAVGQGWDVILVSGPVVLDTPKGLKRVDVVSGDDMFAAVSAEYSAADILIMCAAPSDYRPKEKSLNKVKKEHLNMQVEMEATVDILKTLGKKKTNQFLVGFAAETNDVIENARKKLLRKNCDCIVANEVGGESGGFASDSNTVTLLDRSGHQQSLGPADKREIAQMLIKGFAEKLAKVDI